MTSISWHDQPDFNSWLESFMDVCRTRTRTEESARRSLVGGGPKPQGSGGSAPWERRVDIGGVKKDAGLTMYT